MINIVPPIHITFPLIHLHQILLSLGYSFPDKKIVIICMVKGSYLIYPKGNKIIYCFIIILLMEKRKIYVKYV